MKKIKRLRFNQRYHTWEDPETSKVTSKSGEVMDMVITKLNEIIDELNKLA